MAKLFGLFIWINDDPVTGNVLNLRNIIDPRWPPEQYTVGLKVEARCPGFGKQDAIIGQIGGRWFFWYHCRTFILLYHKIIRMHCA